MGTYADLDIGAIITAPARTLGDDALDVTRGFGGYVHPLFADDAWAREHTPFDRTPVPGELVLFLLGGMAEQTGVFDDTTIALTGFEEVRFLAPAFPGDELTLTMEVLGKQPSSSGRRGSVRLAWRCASGEREILTATAAFLFDLTTG